MWKAQSICSAPFLAYSYSISIFFKLCYTLL